MRIGFGTHFGPFSVFTSGKVSPGKAAGGCLLAVLWLMFLPFILLYYYIKWCIKNNGETDDRPIYLRTWFITTIVLVVVFGIAAAVGGSDDTGEQPPQEPTAVAVQTTPEPTPDLTAESTPEPTPEETPVPEVGEESKEVYDDSWEYADEPMVIDGEQVPAESYAEQQPVEEYAEPSQEAQPQGDTVWIAGSGNGKKYHRDPSCSNMSNPVQISLADAQARGYEACKVCY